jgi:poly(3-hydroxybutyrate) depolymerase
MKLSFAFLAFVLVLLSVSPAAFSKGTSTKERIISNKKERVYYLFVPENNAAKPLPVLILLHGSNRNGFSLVEKWKDLAQKEGILLVGPDASDSSRWSTGPDGPEFLRDIVEALKLKYRIDERRVYLFGHSAGATFALYMSVFESEYFAATAIHAGALPSDSYSDLENAKRKIPMAIWVGDRDPFFPLDQVRATRNLFASKGFPVELTEMPNHDHWYYDLAPKINRSAWEFLKKYELPSDPIFQQYTFR